MKVVQTVKLYILGLFLAASAVALSPVAHAQAADQFVTLSPTTADVNIEAGAEYKGRADVYNNGSKAFKMTASSAPYRVVGDEYEPNFSSLPGKTDPSRWISIDSTHQAVVEPGQMTSVTYNLKVPADTAPGGYYAAVFATTEPVEPGDGGVVQKNRVGQLVFINVKGEVSQNAEVKATKLPLVVLGDRISPKLTVKNSGGTHYKANYQLTITSLFNKTVHQGQKQYYILPQTQRVLSQEWQTSAWFGVYRVEQSITTPDGNVSTLSPQRVVVVHPVLLMIVGVALLLVVAWLLTRRRSSRKAR